MPPTRLPRAAGSNVFLCSYMQPSTHLFKNCFYSENHKNLRDIRNLKKRLKCFLWKEKYKGVLNPLGWSIFPLKRKKKGGGTKQQLWKQPVSTIYIINLTALNGNCKCFDKNQLKSCLPHCCFNKVSLYLLLKPCFCSLLKQYSVLNHHTVSPPKTDSKARAQTSTVHWNFPSATGTRGVNQQHLIPTPSHTGQLHFYCIVKN